MDKVGIVSCYSQHNFGSMLQAYATQKALDKLNIANETINTSGFIKEIRNAKLRYFIKASLTSDILFFKLGMAKNILIKKFFKSNYAVQSRMRDNKFDEFSKKYFRLSEPYSSKIELSLKDRKSVV